MPGSDQPPVPQPRRRATVPGTTCAGCDSEVTAGREPPCAACSAGRRTTARARTCAQCGRCFVAVRETGRPPKLCGDACRAAWQRTWSREYHRARQALLVAERGRRTCVACGSDIGHLRVSARCCSRRCRHRARAAG